MLTATLPVSPLAAVAAAMARYAAALAALSLALCVALASSGALPTLPAGTGEAPLTALLRDILKTANIQIRPGAQCSECLTPLRKAEP